jgi:fumarate hydratase class II
MGEMAVPEEALYGASTQRAVLNFPISGQRFPRRFIRALALVKLAAADTNAELELLDADVANAIAAAAASVADGDHDDQFPIDIYQTGSGTSTNTNMNEVIAHLATSRLGGDRRVHPNDDVNRCQSSNDDIPTALQLSAAMAIEEALIPALIDLQQRSPRRPSGSGRSSRRVGRISRTRRRSGSARSSRAMRGRSKRPSGGSERRGMSC